MSLADKEPDAGLVIAREPELAELGRFVVTREPKDIGRFKTPSLRNVGLTAPYMHDGSVPTLAEAVDLEVYYRSRTSGRPLILLDAEKADIVAFLQTLTADDLQRR
ncbi:c-type cytochrome [Roseateles sp. P5_D6]